MLVTTSVGQRDRAHLDFLVGLRRLLRDCGVFTSAPARCAAGSSGDPTAPADGPALLVGDVKAFIDEHAAEALNLDRIADEVGRSKYHLARLFRDVEGVTLWRYVQEARLRHAKRLLQVDDKPLAEVALEAGFYDQSHFSNVFKAAEGMPPGTWRRTKGERKNLQE